MVPSVILFATVATDNAASDIAEGRRKETLSLEEAFTKNEFDDDDDDEKVEVVAVADDEEEEVLTPL